MAEALSILVVDDSPESAAAVADVLSDQGYTVHTAGNGEEALRLLDTTPVDILVSDVNMPVVDGLELARRVKSDPVLQYLPIVLVTAREDLADILRGFDAGADDYISKPFRREELLARVKAAARTRALYGQLRTASRDNETLRRKLGEEGYEELVGSSAPMLELYGLIERVADADVPILITGESGAGKELVASALHKRSGRRNRAFVVQNCSAFSEQLLESELFGHVKGAFSGAIRDKQGLFSAADGGTFFLDELGEMSLVMQAKLLRVLQDGSYYPVGSTVQEKCNVRIIAATNRNLKELIAKGSFREDLFYRVNVVNLSVPPLRERRSDIPVLAQHFLRLALMRMNRGEKRLTEGMLVALSRYNWPGNARELRNEIERAVLLAPSAEIGPEVLSSHVRSGGAATEGATASQTPSGDLKSALDVLERRMIEAALERNGGNRSETSRELGISRSNLIAKIQLYKIQA